MDGDHPHADALGALGERGGVAAGVVPAEPGLQRDGNVAGFNDRLQNAGRGVEIAHQRAARERAGDAAGGAAHVDVDELGALRRQQPGGLGHRGGIAADELHGEGRALDLLGARAAFRVAFKQAGGGDHFRERERRAASFGGPAHARVGDPGHGREQRAASERELSDPESRLGCA